MPDTGAYDRMASQQMALMDSRSQQETLLMQQRLNQATLGQQNALQELNRLAQQRANNTAADSERIAMLVGTPPPAPSATAPTVASNRASSSRPSGKDALRIDRQGPTAAAQGTSLNIAY